MSAKPKPSGTEENNYVKIAVDLILKLGALFLIIFLSIRIVLPFTGVLFWGLIIAIILFPFFTKLSGWLGNRNKLSSVILSAIILSILLLPSIWLVNQLIEGISILAEHIQDGKLDLTSPPESVADWPIIGNRLYAAWMDMSQNFGTSVKGFMPEIRVFVEKLLGALGSTGLGILQFALAIIISGIFLVFFEQGSETGKKLFNKLAGERGDEFLQTSLRTIRNVAAGVIGVAIIQSALIGVGLVLANVPLAAVWIILVLMMGVAQIPVMFFTIPLIIYLFAFMDPLPAVLWAIYFILMGMIDNILKPIIMGKGSGLPMLVTFIGAVGGFLAFGFIGLFVGAIILSLTYKLSITWLSNE